MTRIVDNGRHVGPRPQRQPGPVPGEEVCVNGCVIGRDQIAAEAQHHPADSPAEAMQAAAHALVVRELLVQEATRRNIAAVPEEVGPGRRETEEDALIRRLLEDSVQVPDADEAACRRFYDANRDKFASPALYEARHILLAAAPDDEAARATADQRARGLIAVLCDDPCRFAELATAWSACTSSESGGNLGQLSPGQTVPEFEAILFQMEEGQVWPEPVDSRYGFHVVALDRRIPGQTLDFETVRERIAAYLEAASWSRGVSQYLSILAGAAKIEGITLPSSDSPLVQ